MSVADLCRLLPGQLRAVVPTVAPDVAITGVHVSELPDPTIGLDGGELLLTIGKSLPPSRQDCRDYVERLRLAGAAALGVGGLGSPRTPPRLVAACRETGLPLLEVRPHTPFLVIGNTYWQLASDDSRRQMSSALTTQADLVRAAASDTGYAELLSVLGDAIGGWAAVFDRHAAIVAASQPVPDEVGGVLHRQVAQLREAGTRASAIVDTDDQHVIIHTFPHPVLACLAVGSGRRITVDDRRAVLTAVSLLTLQLAHRVDTVVAGSAELRSIAHLVDIGEISAARQLAQWHGQPLPGTPVRTVVLDGLGDASAMQLVASTWPDATVIGIDEPGSGWCWLSGVDVGATELREALPGPTSRGAIGPPTDLGHIGSQRRWLQFALRRQQPGTVVDADLDPQARALTGEAESAAWLAPLLTPDQHRNAAALTAYLRHRGQWEAAARALGIHRNTLRYRVGRAAALVCVDLTDPDQQARLWLALRAVGLA